jgi:hypothetical protein
MKSTKSLSILFLSGFILFSCRLTDFTLISTKNVSLDVKKDNPRIEGKGFTIKDAIDKAVENAGPGYDALIDGVIYEGFLRYKVVGTPIKTTEINSNQKK